MPRPNVGNPGNSGGIKGRSGRKSAYQERADAELLWRVFIEKHSKQELVELLKDKYSIKDVWITKAFNGNERFIQQIVHKLFPEKMEVDEKVIIHMDI